MSNDFSKYGICIYKVFWFCKRTESKTYLPPGGLLLDTDESRVSSLGQKCEQTSANINNFVHELFTLWVWAMCELGNKKPSLGLRVSEIIKNIV